MSKPISIKNLKGDDRTRKLEKSHSEHKPRTGSEKSRRTAEGGKSPSLRMRGSANQGRRQRSLEHIFEEKDNDVSSAESHDADSLFEVLSVAKSPGIDRRVRLIRSHSLKISRSSRKIGGFLDESQSTQSSSMSNFQRHSARAGLTISKKNSVKAQPIPAAEERPRSSRNLARSTSLETSCHRKPRRRTPGEGSDTKPNDGDVKELSRNGAEELRPRSSRNLARSTSLGTSSQRKPRRRTTGESNKLGLSLARPKLNQ